MDLVSIKVPAKLHYTGPHNCLSLCSIQVNCSHERYETCKSPEERFVDFRFVYGKWGGANASIWS